MTQHEIEPPTERDDQSMDRCEHLLARHDRDPEEGLEAYRKAEKSLSGIPHRGMSQLTRHLLQGLDYWQVARRRLRNFRALQDLFGPTNRMPLQVNQ